MQHWHDPIGPGTPAWEQFDSAVLAKRRAGPQPPWGQRHAWRTSKVMKSYFNHRQVMIAHLRRHGADKDKVRQWCDALDAAVVDMDYLTDYPNGVAA